MALGFFLVGVIGGVVLVLFASPLAGGLWFLCSAAASALFFIEDAVKALRVIVDFCQWYRTVESYRLRTEHPNAEQELKKASAQPATGTAGTKRQPDPARRRREAEQERAEVLARLNSDDEE